MTLSFSLEDFDIQKTETDQQALNEAHARGYAEGLAAGQEQTAQSEASLLAELGQILSDLEITFDEARIAGLASLKPLFSTIAEQIAPSAVDSVLYGELLDEIENAAAHDSGQAAVISLSPDNLEMLAPLIESQVQSRIKLVSDHSLERGQARFKTQSSETLLDSNQVINKIQTSLMSLNDCYQKEKENG